MYLNKKKIIYEIKLQKYKLHAVSIFSPGGTSEYFVNAVGT